MRILTKLANRLGWVSKVQASAQAQAAVREYGFGQVNRLTADWVNGNDTDANSEIGPSLKTMRKRSRNLDRDEGYLHNYFRLLLNNVLGANGIGLQMKVTENKQVGGKWVSGYDTLANSIIESCWNKWGRKEFCTITRNLTWLDVQRLTLKSVATAGACLHKKQVIAPWGFALEPIEADQLDTDYNVALQSGRVRLGKQFNAANECTGYYLLSKHPGDEERGAVASYQRVFVPAKDIIDVYWPDRVGAATGVPWIHTCGVRAKNLSGYEEAAVIAARVAASKMVFFKRATPAEFPGTKVEGMPETEVSPGMMQVLPDGYEPVPFDPSHPNEQTPAFIKCQLRGIAAGLGVSYTSLANDLEGVNYSSIRAGLLEERENWKAIQQWFIDWFIRPVFEEWLSTALALGQITDGRIVLPASKFDKFNAPDFKPRRWDWVDPLKDVQASVLAIEKKLTSRRRVIAEGGGDIEDVFTELQEDEVLAEEKGIDLTDPSKEEANTATDKPKGSNGTGKPLTDSEE